MSPLRPFHLAFPVADLAKARAFYGGVLGCREGRSSDDWIDFDFFGHQIVAHLAPEEPASVATHAVDGVEVPVRHFGVVLSMEDWKKLSDDLARAGVRFLVQPRVRFRGQAGEQSTLFFVDPFGNAIELKAFRDLGRLFEK